MDEAPARRASRARLAVAAASGSVALVLGLVWSQRAPIAAHYVDRELARRGVPASYKITRFGVGGQRLEKIRIGDPARPDLTAEWAELRIDVGWGTPTLRAVSAGGVRLRGRLVDGRVTLGAIDRLLPKPTGAPFSLPDIVVVLSDARMRLDTAGGPVAFSLAGQGRLTDGFTGRLGASAPMLDVAGCTIETGRANVNLSIVRRAPALDGPVRAASLRCPKAGVSLSAPALDLDVALGPALDRWTGGARMRVAEVRQRRSALTQVSGRIGFTGAPAGTSGPVAIVAERMQTVGLTAGRSGFEGRYGFGKAVRVQGELTLAGGAADGATRAAILAAGATGAGTPAGPISRAIADAAARAASRFEGRAQVDYAGEGSAGKLRLARVTATSASGARLVATQGDGIGIDWPSGATRIDGRVQIAGGGLPETDARLAQPRSGAPIAGEVRVAEFATGGARMRLAPVRFDTAPGASRFATELTLDGPVASGRVTGMTVPVQGRLGRGGAFVVNATCAPLTFDRLSLFGLEVGRSRLALCPQGAGLLSRSAGGAVRGGGRVEAPRLAGTLGGSPIAIAARGLDFDISGPEFVADRLAVLLGPADARTALNIERLGGRFLTGGVAGRFGGLSGRIVNVPLRMSDGAGAWRLIGGKLSVAGDALTVADAAAEPRFRPLLSRNVALTLVDSQIVASGRLAEPETGTTVTDVTIRHDLSRAAGAATLQVPGITFGPGLQPERLTRLTLGVVANVSGTVSGRGDIRWDRTGVSSTGRFATESMDLAAAFGPVRGLATTVEFDDLLALRTAKSQVARVAEINTGIAVREGVVRYQLLQGQRVQVEGGSWPFSGGTLSLDPTLLDFSGPTDRRLTFRVKGMDAAQFVQQFDFKNIAVTGTFDGILPMVFDTSGGRIVGGRLSVRPGGGTLAYVGEISNAALGVYGRLAFDALKSMRYEALTIDLDGSLDGELVSRVLFDGTNQTPREAIRRNGLLSQFSNLPFRFNITIRAPFRGLLNSAASLNDPRALIRQSMPPDEAPLPGSASLAAPPIAPQAVQTQESEAVR